MTDCRTQRMSEGNNVVSAAIFSKVNNVPGKLQVDKEIVIMLVIDEPQGTMKRLFPSLHERNYT